MSFAAHLYIIWDLFLTYFWFISDTFPVHFKPNPVYTCMSTSNMSKMTELTKQNPLHTTTSPLQLKILVNETIPGTLTLLKSGFTLVFGENTLQIAQNELQIAFTRLLATHNGQNFAINFTNNEDARRFAERVA